LTALAIDGDTIAYQGHRWRLVGFNAPEWHKPACFREGVHAWLAKRMLQSYFDRGAIVVEVFDLGRDPYGRRLGRAFLDGQPVAKLMIGAGLAERFECNRGGCPKRRRNWCK
jgi:endonuclease YncB( thermonuclease family)